MNSYKTVLKVFNLNALLYSFQRVTSLMVEPSGFRFLVLFKNHSPKIYPIYRPQTLTESYLAGFSISSSIVSFLNTEHRINRQDCSKSVLIHNSITGLKLQQLFKSARRLVPNIYLSKSSFTTTLDNILKHNMNTIRGNYAVDEALRKCV